MPRFDGTGPQGSGPRTGRGMGNCPPAAGPGWGRGFGWNRGMGCGFGRGRGRGWGANPGWGRMFWTEQDWKDSLLDYKQQLENELVAVQEQLDGLKE